MGALARQSHRHCTLGRKSNSEAALFMNSEGVGGGTRVRACSCTPVRALMRAIVSRLCACMLNITVP